MRIQDEAQGFFCFIKVGVPETAPLQVYPHMGHSSHILPELCSSLLELG